MPVLVLDAGSRDQPCSSRAARAPTSSSASGRISSMPGASRSRTCATPWALMLDADEALDDVLRDAICDAPRERGRAMLCTVRPTSAASRCASGATSGCCGSFARAVPCSKRIRPPRRHALLHEAWDAMARPASLPERCCTIRIRTPPSYRVKYDALHRARGARDQGIVPAFWLAASAAGVARSGMAAASPKGALLRRAARLVRRV